MTRRLLAWLLAVAVLAAACGTPEPNRVRVARVTPVAELLPTAATPLAPAELAPERTPEPTPEPPPPPEPVADPNRVPSVPVRLRIPRIGVDASIIPVGVNAYGEMDSPNDAWTVGWYAPGFRPWDLGNAVLAGHVDYVRVGPAVFYRVRWLGPGDMLSVTGANGQVYDFAVTEVRTYYPTDAPIGRIFGPNPNRGLVLVTCTGAFDAASGQYDQRVVVYAEAVKTFVPPPTERLQAGGG